MSEEPKEAKKESSITTSKLEVDLYCCGDKECSAQVRVEAKRDPKTQEVYPVGVPWYICLNCWRKGYRYENEATRHYPNAPTPDSPIRGI